MGGSWQWVDQKFTAAVPTPAQITSPPAGSALTMEPAVFNWSAGVFVDAYWLNVGTSQGGYDLYSGYMGNTRAAAINLPVISKKLWVRLYSHIGTQWYFVDVPYSSAPAVPAQIVTPAPGSTITAGTVTLAWSKGRAVQAYWLDVGTAQGGYDLSSGYRGTSQAASIPGVPVGTIWVRIWSLIDGSWRFVDAKFTAK
jgi:hypothetical protein